ncbi:MAG: hypothetical protein HY554_09840 [Elusimicrobia bacterium]|nr:hypothetical protein [Elusimicrobiota bacterium]
MKAKRDAEKAEPRKVLGALRLLSLLAALALSPLAPLASADPNPGNDSDEVTIHITPIFDLGVHIDTAAVSLDFALAPGATAFTVTPATVTILGNIQPQELEIAAANVSASPVWTLDVDETAALDELQLYALFSVGRSSSPLAAEFAGAKNLVTGSAKRAGKSPGAAADENFENNSMTGGADMDNILLLAPERQLWLRMDVPPLTTTESEQSIRVTITATRSSL